MIKRYNIALLFSRDLELSIIEFAAMLVAGHDASHVPAPNAQPHLTLLQFELDEGNFHKMRNRCLSSLPNVVEIDFSGLTFLPSSKGGMWVEISVIRTNALVEVQQRCLEVLGHIEVLNKTGEKYRPHVTLGRFKEYKIPPISLDYALLRTRGVQARPGFGLSGGLLSILG